MKKVNMFGNLLSALIFLEARTPHASFLTPIYPFTLSSRLAIYGIIYYYENGISQKNISSRKVDFKRREYINRRSRRLFTHTGGCLY